MTTTDHTLSHSLLLLLAEAAQDGTAALPGIIEAINATPSAVLDAPEQATIGQMLALAEAGTPPTVAEMRRRAPHIAPSYWARRSAESSVQAVINGLIDQHAGRELEAVLQEALADIRQGRINAATASERLIAAGAGLTVGQASLGSLAAYDTDRLRLAVPRIAVPIPALNDVLGGGLPTAGNATFSFLIGHTGMGKSTLAYQIALHNVLEGGISVIYTGENGEDAVWEALARLWYCRVHGEAISHGGWMSDAKGQHPGRRHQAVLDIQTAHGHQLYASEHFGSESIIAGLSQVKKAHPDAKILAIVDNVDHLHDTTLADHRTPLHATLDQAARRLSQAARRLGVHIMALAQADEASKRAARAPGVTDLRKSTSMPHHAGIVMSLYRPPVGEHTTVDTILSVPKNRAGTGNTITRPNDGPDTLVNYGAGWWVGSGWRA